MTGLVTSSQIQLFPPAYMLNRFKTADVLIILEEAQYTKKQFFDHFAVGEREVNFKIPLNGGSSRRPLDKVTMVDFDKWTTVVERDLPVLYSETDNFREGFAWFMKVLEECRNYDSLQNVCIHTLDSLFRALEIRTTIMFSKVLVPQRPQDPSLWIAELAKAARAEKYFQGRDAMDAYFQAKPFEDRRIELCCQQWHPPQAMKSYIGMQRSILHSIFLQGFEKTALGLQGHGVEPWPVRGD